VPLIACQAPPDLAQRLKDRAKVEDRSASSIVRLAIGAYLNDEGRPATDAPVEDPRIERGREAA
jgi:predicted transcriptional regulator